MTVNFNKTPSARTRESNMPTPNLTSTDLYEVLGCERDADDSTLKKAYRKLAVKYHPDKNPDDEEATKKFQKISEAYATLSDPHRRRLYNRKGAKGVAKAERAETRADRQSQDNGNSNKPPGAKEQPTKEEHAKANFRRESQAYSFKPGVDTAHMSPQEAQEFFQSFFGNTDPFAPSSGDSVSGGSVGGQSVGAQSVPGNVHAGRPHSSFPDKNRSRRRASMGTSAMGGSTRFDNNKNMRSSMGANKYASMRGSNGRDNNLRHSMHSSMNGQRHQSHRNFDSRASFAGRAGAGMPNFNEADLETDSYDSIPEGTSVSLKNLVSQPQRNGDKGVVDSYDSIKGRYAIRLEGSNEILRVKPSNLLQHVHVTLQGIESQPELNGKRGTIIAWNEAKQRYSVYVMEKARTASLKPFNVVLDKGTVGQIVGLSAKPELNGKYGMVKRWISETNRYDVQLSQNQVIRVKVESMRV